MVVALWPELDQPFERLFRSPDEERADRVQAAL
jgi:hypothetical protein